MMDNIEKVLQILLRRVSSEMVISGQIQCDRISETDFIALMRNYMEQYSETELYNMYNYLTGTFLSKYYAVSNLEDMKKGLDVFSFLKCYSAWILKYQGNEVVCEYMKMFRWRKMTIELSEDLFVAAFLAQRDYTVIRESVDFGWKSFISHNNVELNKIVNQGICENHYHLKGSAPFFQLSWVSIMNNVVSSSYIMHLQEIDKDRRSTNKKYVLEYKEPNLCIQVFKAAVIRLFLVSLLLEVPIFIEYNRETADNSHTTDDSDNTVSWEEHKNELFKIIYKYLTDDELIQRDNNIIQGQISAFKNLNFEISYPDYALQGINAIEIGNKYAFEGERWFLYEMFKRIFGNDEEIGRYKNLFYAYIIIKENIRAEFVQSNADFGFENFRKYQDRKEYFLEDKFFENQLVKSAVQSSLFESNVVTLEARLAPKDDAKDIKEQIDKYDRIIDYKKYGNRYFYAMHFIKTGADKYKESIVAKCRHNNLRRKVEKQARAIALVREIYPKEGSRIRAIDAANTEIGCGPEVFAQAFRFLVDHTVENGIYIENKRCIEGLCGNSNRLTMMPQLRMTYHVGEDFLDVVSGLRAIDEAINFLNLGCGSRLGHALALGIDIKDWYEVKKYRIDIPQHEYLDNIVWLYSMVSRFELNTEPHIIKALEQEYSYYFNIIYGRAIQREKLENICYNARKYYKDSNKSAFYIGNEFDFGMNNYYRAWSLRGDNPESYKSGFFREILDNYTTSNHYEHYYINHSFPIKQEERFMKEVGVLYYLYHFDENVRINGEQSIEIKIHPTIVELVSKVQKAMQKMVSSYGIGIECNPSSNCKIGTFKRYDKHPIIDFYNRGLVENEELLRQCEQLNVSINTDDQGVFNVSLENEYAYMALALEKAKDSEGKPLYKRAMIYKWLDDIRKMGINQTFLNNKEMKKAFEEWRKQDDEGDEELFEI